MGVSQDIARCENDKESNTRQEAGGGCLPRQSRVPAPRRKGEVRQESERARVCVCFYSLTEHKMVLLPCTSHYVRRATVLRLRSFVRTTHEVTAAGRGKTTLLLLRGQLIMTLGPVRRRVARPASRRVLFLAVCSAVRCAGRGVTAARRWRRGADEQLFAQQVHCACTPPPPPSCQQCQPRDSAAERSASGSPANGYEHANYTTLSRPARALLSQYCVGRGRGSFQGKYVTRNVQITIFVAGQKLR